MKGVAKLIANGQVPRVAAEMDEDKSRDNNPSSRLGHVAINTNARDPES